MTQIKKEGKKERKKERKKESKKERENILSRNFDRCQTDLQYLIITIATRMKAPVQAPMMIPAKSPALSCSLPLILEPLDLKVEEEDEGLEWCRVPDL